jgi:hypothetical protein
MLEEIAVSRALESPTHLDPGIVYLNAHAIRINCSVIHMVHSESLKDHYTPTHIHSCVEQKPTCDLSTSGIQ